MKNTALLLGLFVASVVADDVPSLSSSMIKSYKRCLQTGNFDKDTIALAKSKDADNQQVNCFRGCVLLDSELISDKAVFNRTKLEELLRADENVDAIAVEIYMGMADICVKLAKGVTDKCKVAEKYFKCFLIMVGI